MNASDPVANARLLSLRETAIHLGCSVKTLRRLIGRGEFAVIRVGRLLRVRPEDLEGFIASRRSA